MSRLHAPWFAQHGAATSGEAVVLAASLLNRRPASRILLKQRSGDLRLHLGLADHGVQVGFLTQIPLLAPTSRDWR